MRLRIHHNTVYRYQTPARRIVQAMRLWPAPVAGQQVLDWQVMVGGRGLRPRSRDGFGNAEATYSADGPLDELCVGVVGQVITEDRHGVIQGSEELLDPLFYCAPSVLTQPDQALRELAERCRRHRGLEQAHQLMRVVREAVEFKTEETHSETDASEALAHGYGVCQDHAHVMIACARILQRPARYVSGYLWIDGDSVSPASHAWSELYIDDLGWVGFDPANRICPTESYVRVAVGRDARDAAPIRGLRQGGTVESLEVNVSVAQVSADPARTQSQPVQQ
ncbi:transglutaminase family protein [Pseudomarimonas arenosa]|uniref:Transglutaminase family protein n=1 Tax=Pseudomarimonas arenosa TaxID=2774145 RepID=A0AAW3ZK89_9GAMM|nr:transglutaminase family protein [Pseudomarimonas arenosa]MBD8525119.1 transglutaminase family protein [Pseudomarimonas arenosa]